jgi:hypothetical protein
MKIEILDPLFFRALNSVAADNAEKNGYDRNYQQNVNKAAAAPGVIPEEADSPDDHKYYGN